MLPFLLGTVLIIGLGLLLLYDPFRVAVQLTLLLVSVFGSSILGWALWLSGNVIVVSFFAANDLAWDTSVIVGMPIGPVAVRWIIIRVLLSEDTHIARDVSIVLAGAFIGALIGRYVLSELFPAEYTSIGISGNPRVMWTWAGATLGGHSHAVAIAARSVWLRREP